jgi:hypothetical protein
LLVLTRLCPVRLFPHNYSLPSVLSLACFYTIVSCTLVPSQLFIPGRFIPFLFLHGCFLHECSLTVILFGQFYPLLVLTRLFPARMFPYNFRPFYHLLVLTRLFPFTHAPSQLLSVLSLGCSYTVLSFMLVPSQLFSSVRSIPCLFLHDCFLHECSQAVLPARESTRTIVSCRTFS